MHNSYCDHRNVIINSVNQALATNHSALHITGGSAWHTTHDLCIDNTKN